MEDRKAQTSPPTRGSLFPLSDEVVLIVQMLIPEERGFLTSTESTLLIIKQVHHIQPDTIATTASTAEFLILSLA